MGAHRRQGGMAEALLGTSLLVPSSSTLSYTVSEAASTIILFVVLRGKKTKETGHNYLPRTRGTITVLAKRVLWPTGPEDRGPAFVCWAPPKAQHSWNRNEGAFLCFLVWWSCNPIPVILLPPASPVSGTCYLESCSAVPPCSVHTVPQISLQFIARTVPQILLQLILFLKTYPVQTVPQISPVQTVPQILPGSNWSSNLAQLKLFPESRPAQQ